MRVSLPSGTYTDNAKIASFWTRLDERDHASARRAIGGARFRPAAAASAEHERHRTSKDS